MAAGFKRPKEPWRRSWLLRPLGLEMGRMASAIRPEPGYPIRSLSMLLNFHESSNDAIRNQHVNLFCLTLTVLGSARSWWPGAKAHLLEALTYSPVRMPRWLAWLCLGRQSLQSIAAPGQLA